METAYRSVRQEVINDSAEIFNKICTELNNAEEEVLIASAWFTDPELLKIVEEKASSGLILKLIIADNEENKKLDFSKAERLGASLIRIKNVGFGMMHQKFCVIDRKLAIHGSYNWSVNARKNNHESVILTDHKDTVDSLVKMFSDIVDKARLKSDAKKGPLSKIIDKIMNRRPANVVELNETDDLKAIDELLQQPYLPEDGFFKVKEDDSLQYRKVLDSMIAAEISGFDRASLRQQGTERSRANNGDHQVLSKSLDSVYSVFINDINVVDDKKKRLLSKIQEQKTNQQDFLRIRKEDRLNAIESDINESRNKFKKRIGGLDAENQALEAEIKSIESTKIGGILNNIAAIKEKIINLKLEFAPLGKKKFQQVPLFVFGALVIMYLILFYSSATYILLFSKGDAEIAAAMQRSVMTPEVFNPKALALAFEKGYYALAVTIFFPIVLIALSIVNRLVNPAKTEGNKGSFWTSFWEWVTIAGILSIDGIIATKISQSIHEVNYLSGNTTDEWHFSVLNLDFLLVFVMGAVGLFIFKGIYSRLIELYEERSPDVNTQKKRLEIKELEKGMEEKHGEVQLLKTQIDEKYRQVIQNKAEIILNESEIESLPFQSSLKTEQANNDFNIKNQNIQQITDIYISHIENDNLPLSVDSLKDRMNIFLEGWNDYLHNEFSVSKATEKGFLASEAASSWLNNKLSNNKLDHRIKL
jgi:hypothetical protein